MLNKLMTGMIGAGVAMVLANFSIYLINPGEQSLIMDQIHGLKPEVKGPGYHLRIPIIQVQVVLGRM